MNFRPILFSLILLSLASCATNMRDKQKQRNGLWIETKPTMDGDVTSRGRYKHGEMVGKWTWKFGDTLYQRDKIRKKLITTKYFYPNGKLMANGQSRLEISGGKEGHRLWYKFGPWNEFDKNGNLLWVKYYDKGIVYQYQENGIMKYDTKRFLD